MKTNPVQDFVRTPHLFAKVMGTNFRDYVNSFRLDYALQLIRSTEKSMNEIAFATGFESQRSFNRVFRKKLGVPPIHYRRVNKPEAQILPVG